jgi:hypothetical protein
VFALIALVCWSFASPVGAAPDDTFHLASIWCGWGDRPGLCESVPGHSDWRRVPDAIVYANLCYAGKPDESAACLSKSVTDNDNLVPTTRGNFVGTYPPVYYAFMSLFASTNIPVSAVLMRVINAVIFLGLTSVLFLLLPFSRRSTLIWAWLVSIVPLGMFLLASTNSSAWAIISGGSLWLALVGYFESTGRRKIWLGVLSLVLALLGSGVRADSAAYCVGAVAVALILTARRSREYWTSALLALGVVVLSVALYFTASQSSVTITGFSGGNAPANMPALTLFADSLLNVPSLWAGSLGSWGLGSLDVNLPPIVWVGCLTVFGAIVFAGLRSYTGRKLLALGLVFLAAWLIPSWIQTTSRSLVGTNVQPRYIYPVLIMLVGVAMLVVTRRRIHVNRPQAAIIGFVVVAANSVALHVTIHRYTAGQQYFGFNLDHNEGWWWPGLPFSPMAVWILGTLSFAAAVAVVIWQQFWFDDPDSADPVDAYPSAAPAAEGGGAVPPQPVSEAPAATGPLDQPATRSFSVRSTGRTANAEGSTSTVL